MDLTLSQALQVAIDAAHQAADILRKHFYQIPQISTTTEQMPSQPIVEGHSQADLLAERKIREILCAFDATWGFRAEEEPEFNRVSTSAQQETWLVDPNDGTSAFMKGERGASVSIALIRNQEPVLGVIYAYAAPNTQGDLFTWADQVSPLQRNGKVITPQWTSEWNQHIIFVSNQADRISQAYKNVLQVTDENQHQQLTQTQHARYRVAPGIAYRLALCAVGEGEAAISIAGPRDFDYAAGHALLRGAGGDLWNERGQVVHYDSNQMQRLGFGFGGQECTVKTLLSQEWKGVFEAWRDRRHNSCFTQAHQSYLTQSDHLSRMQGVWWGWHIAHAVWKAGQVDQIGCISAQLTLENLDPSWMRLHGGDQLLIGRLRGALNVFETDSSVLKKRLQDAWPTHLLVLLRNGVNTDETQVAYQSAVYDDQHMSTCQHFAETLAMYGFIHGRAIWPSRCVSELLAYREGEMSTWQPDGDRLIEKVSFLLDLF